jgi:hypothetical protein
MLKIVHVAEDRFPQQNSCAKLIMTKAPMLTLTRVWVREAA